MYIYIYTYIYIYIYLFTYITHIYIYIYVNIYIYICYRKHKACPDPVRKPVSYRSPWMTRQAAGRLMCSLSLPRMSEYQTAGFLNLKASEEDVQTAVSYSRFSKVHTLDVLPDPGALNSCMHTSPEDKYGFTLLQRVIQCIWIWGLRPSNCCFANSNYEN